VSTVFPLSLPSPSFGVWREQTKELGEGDSEGGEGGEGGRTTNI